MKQETKRKIVDFIKKVLGYKEAPIVKKLELPTENVSFQLLIKKEFIKDNMPNKERDQIVKSSLVAGLFSKLDNQKLISYRVMPSDKKEKSIVEISVSVLKPNLN